uniref:Uncharacterized protein n=1 Tax=Aeromonas phage vB_AdhaP_MF TaxID=3367373 RepID=A0AB74UP16_9CAUD
MFYMMYLAMSYILMRLDAAISRQGKRVLSLVDKEGKVRDRAHAARKRGEKAQQAAMELAASIEKMGNQVAENGLARQGELLRKANAIDLERKGVIHMQNHMAQMRNSVVDSKNLAKSSSPMALRLDRIKSNLKFWEK